MSGSGSSLRRNPHGWPDTLEDPRVDRTKRHPLTDILVLSVLVAICGADSFVAIALFGQLNEEWLRTFLALPHGIPSHDTLGRVFARLDAGRFEEGFRDWVQAAFALTDGQVVPIDGKSVRGSHDRGRGLGPLHLVSAWAQANRLVLAQTAVDDQSNEITAIPELLRMLCLEGCIVTLDAMGCQKKIARQIRAQEADYLQATSCWGGPDDAYPEDGVAPCGTEGLGGGVNDRVAKARITIVNG